MKVQYRGTRMEIVNGRVVLPGEVVEVDPRQAARLGPDFVIVDGDQEKPAPAEPETQTPRRRGKRA